MNKTVGDSVKENKTVENMERIFKAAKQNGFEVFISPHYFFPTDPGWKFNGPLETDEAENKMFARSGRFTMEDLLCGQFTMEGHLPGGISGHNLYHTADGNYIKLGPKGAEPTNLSRGVCPPGTYMDKTLGIYTCRSIHRAQELHPNVKLLNNRWQRAW